MTSNGLPRVGQIVLGEDFSRAWDAESDRYRETLLQSLKNTGCSLPAICAQLEIDRSHMNRIESGDANPPARLVLFALFHDPTHTFIRYLAPVAGGEFKPLPPPGPEHWFPLVVEDLARRGLWDLVAKAIGYVGLPSPTGQQQEHQPTSTTT